MRAAELVLIGFVLMVAVSCDNRPRLPFAPSDLTTGIVIYEFQDYQGESAHLTGDISDLDDVKGPCIKTESEGGTTTTTEIWDDCISSVRVAPGWEAHLYEHPNFGGWDQSVREDVSDLGEVLGPCHSDDNLDNCVSSIRVFQR